MGLAQWIVAEARSRSGLGLRELARRSGTSHATLRKYERGEVDPGVATLERIVAACGYELRVQFAEPDRAAEHNEAAFAALSPAERLETLGRWQRMLGMAGDR